MTAPRLAIVAVALLAVACGPGAQGATTPTATTAPAPAATAAPTSAAPAAGTPASDTLAMTCTSPATPATAMTEGPYYKADPPQKASLVTEGLAGTRIVLTGYVLTRSCAPVAGAKVDVWQADSRGAYDNSGYTLRGYVLTDDMGRYRIETIVPGEYPGRTEHIHVKIWVGGSALTTQLYFPGQASNSGDGIYRPENLLKITQGTPLVGRFDFIVDRA